MSRVSDVADTLMDYLTATFPRVEWLRTYVPRLFREQVTQDKTYGFVTLEDVSQERKNASGLKFYETHTYTIAIVKKMDAPDAPAEVDAVLAFVEQVRDTLQNRIVLTESISIRTTGPEHQNSRPVYDRRRLESERLLVSYLLLDVVIDAEIAR